MTMCFSAAMLRIITAFGLAFPACIIAAQSIAQAQTPQTKTKPLFAARDIAIANALI